MKGVEKLCFLFVYLTSLNVKSLWGQKCKSDDDCKFKGRCNDGICWCTENCSNLGYSFLCGENGKYYKNKCYHLMEMCEIQKEIKIVGIGANSHCRKHDLHKYAVRRDFFPSFRVCNSSPAYCQNYGVCLQNNHLTRFCVCPSEFVGARCEDKRDDDALKPIPQQVFASFAENKPSSASIVVLFVLCSLSALFSSIVTSAVCRWYSANRFKKILKTKKKFTKIPEDLLIVQANLASV